jgi:hypothetical protein
MKKILSIFAITLLQSSVSLAQGIGDVSIEPKSPSLNQPFKVTINSNVDTPACGLQINLGDGTTRDIRAEKFPVVVDHTYAKEGNFAIAVNGKMIIRGLSSMFPCAGDAKTLAVGIGTQSGSPIVGNEQGTPQIQVPATTVELPQIQTQTKFFSKHITGEEPKWIMEYLQSFQKNVCPMYTVCNMHSSWRENLQVCDRNLADSNSPINFFLERISKSYEAVNEVQKGFFNSQNCKKEIKNASDFLVNNQLNEISNTYASNVKSFEDKNNEIRAKIEQELKDKTIAAENKKNEDLLKAQSIINELLRKNNLEMVYKKESFVITKNRQGQFVYIKDGAIRKNSEVKEDIDSYNSFVILEREQKAQFEIIKKKNLAYRWVVQAQAVCSGGSSCQITRISEGQRLEDGSATFSISHQTRRGSGGSSGVATINCGFNQSNTLRSTSVNAACQ